MESKRGNPDIAELGKETQFKSGSTAVEAGRLGGIRSGQAKRARRTARQAAQRLLAMPAKGKMLEYLKEMGYEHDDEGGVDNIDVLVARLLVMAAGGNLQASERLTKIAGYDSEEERKERESINADRRKNRESEARMQALEAGVIGRHSTSVTDGEEGDSVEDVFVYLPDNGRDQDLQKRLETKSDTGVEGGADTAVTAE